MGDGGPVSAGSAPANLARGRRSAFVWIDRGENPRGSLLGEDQGGFTIDFGRALAITADDWEKILAKASEGVEPPEAHAFIRDARQAQNAGNHRRAVLDAATTAEIALAELRDDAVKGAGADIGRYLSKNVTEIKRSADFLRSIGVVVPENITDHIAKPRNSAIHKGRDLGEETAGRAPLKAEEVVERATPWSDLL